MNQNKTLSEVHRHTDLRVPIESEEVAAMRYEPVDIDKPCPVLLMYVPYHKDDWITYGAYDSLNNYLAARGYEVIVADMLGTGASSGQVDEMFTQREGEEAVKLIAWLADQNWTTGSVGMYGKSYGGITSLAAASRQPDALEAIIPIETPYLGYRNGYTYGGLMELLTIGMDWLTLMQVLDVKPPSQRDSEGNWADMWRDRLEHVRSRRPWLFQFLDHKRKDKSYWGDKDIPVEQVNIPTLAVGGWRDPYTTDTVDYFGKINAPKQLLFGPWRHVMPHRGREEAINFRERAADWFDYFLKGTGTNPLNEDTVQVWTELDGNGETGVWQGLERLPSPSDCPNGYDVEQFDLTTEGTELSENHDGRPLTTEYEFDQTVGLESTTPYRSPVAPQDTSADDARSLCFDTESFKHPIEFTGTGAARIRLESTVSDPTLAVRLVDVAPDGTAKLVTHGSLRVSRRQGLDEEDPLEPGNEYLIEVPIEAKSHVFDTGHRLRVAISSSYFPTTKPTGEHGSFIVRSSPAQPSSISIPVRRYEKDSIHQTTNEMEEPAEESAREDRWTVRSDALWETARERTSDRGKVRQDYENEHDLPHMRLHESGKYEASVKSDDPTSWVANNKLQVTLEYDNEQIEIYAASRLAETICKLETVIKIDKEKVFEESWTRIGDE